MKIICCEVLQGVKPFACKELLARFGNKVSILPGDDPESIYLRYSGDLHRLLGLRTVVAVYLVQCFPVPRPRALLGHQHFQALLHQIETVRSLDKSGTYPAHTFSSFRISAAGEDSSTFARIKAEISRETGLLLSTGLSEARRASGRRRLGDGVGQAGKRRAFDPENGELLLRIRPCRGDLYGRPLERQAGSRGDPREPAPTQTEGWEVLARISPRPLSARPWRVQNMEGALNATIAAVMIEMTAPRPSDRFLNPMCGSGTLLIERIMRGPAREVIGCDIDPQALAAARANVQGSLVAGPHQDKHRHQLPLPTTLTRLAKKSGGLLRSTQASRKEQAPTSALHRPLSLLEMDATALQFPAHTFDVICADLPWGQLVGTHQHNADLYPRVLAEAARVATPQARLVLLTHEIKLFEEVLQEYSNLWTLKDVVRIYQGGLHPRIYLFQRSP